MAEVGSAYVSLLPSARGFGKKISSEVGPDVDQAGDSIGKRFGSKIGSAIKVGLAAGGVALAFFAKSTIQAASDAQQSLGATSTVFGKFADTVIKTSGEAAQKYGLSANTYRENANLIGSLFKNQGVATDELAGKTDEMIGIGADLAATFGGTTTDAVQTLGAAFKGEYDSIERYGISLKESTVTAELAKRGQDKLTGAALAQAKQQVITDLILKQSTDSLGAFGRESGTLAGQQQRLAAQFENIKATLGTALLPVLTRVGSYINATVLPAFTGFINGMKNGTGAGGTFKAALDKIWAAMQLVGTVLGTVVGFLIDNKEAVAGFVTVLAGFMVIQKVTAAVAAFNLVLAANPISLVVLAIAALTAGLIYAYKNSATFRKIVDRAFAAVAAAGKAMWNNVLRPAFDAFKKALEAVGKAGTWLWNNALQPAFQFIVRGVGELMKMWGNMLRALGKVPGFGWAERAGDTMLKAGEKAIGMADNIKKIPNSKTTNVSAPGLEGAKNSTRDYGDLLRNLPREIQTTIITNRVNKVTDQLAGARALGGPVTANDAFLVGERGPEIFVPYTDGTIVPNSRIDSSVGPAAGSGAGLRPINQYFPASTEPEAAAAAAGGRVVAALSAVGI